MYPPSPVCGSYVDPALSACVNPPVKDPTAWKRERTRAVSVQDGEFKFKIRWRARDRLPTPISSVAIIKQEALKPLHELIALSYFIPATF